MEEFFDDKNLVFCYNTMGIEKHFAIIFLKCYNILKETKSEKGRTDMDSGNIWNSLYTSQLLGTQMYGLQADPFNTYDSYADAWQASPWQYGLQAGSVYGNALQQTWQNAGFIDTLNDALTKYTETSKDGELADTGMDISTHKGNVLQLGYDKALVYLPEEQKIMIVQTAGDSSAAGDSGTAGNGKTTVKAGRERNIEGTGIARHTETTSVSGNGNIDEKGILVNQRHARASAAYRRTQSARQRSSLWAKEGNDV